MQKEVETLFTPEQRKRILFTWDQSHNATVRGTWSPSIVGKPWFIKRLGDASRVSGVDEKRILFVDDQVEKTFGSPFGSTLLVPGYTAASTEEEDAALRPCGDLSRALQCLADAAPEDAHAFVRGHPLLEQLAVPEDAMLMPPEAFRPPAADGSSPRLAYLREKQKEEQDLVDLLNAMLLSEDELHAQGDETAVASDRLAVSRRKRRELERALRWCEDELANIAVELGGGRDLPSPKVK